MTATTNDPVDIAYYPNEGTNIIALTSYKLTTDTDAGTLKPGTFSISLFYLDLEEDADTNGQYFGEEIESIHVVGNQIQSYFRAKAIEIVENTNDEYIYVALEANVILRIKTQISIAVANSGFRAD